MTTCTNTSLFNPGLNLIFWKHVTSAKKKRGPRACVCEHVALQPLFWLATSSPFHFSGPPADAIYRLECASLSSWTRFCVAIPSQHAIKTIVRFWSKIVANIIILSSVFCKSSLSVHLASQILRAHRHGHRACDVLMVCSHQWLTSTSHFHKSPLSFGPGAPISSCLFLGLQKDGAWVALDWNLSGSVLSFSLYFVRVQGGSGIEKKDPGSISLLRTIPLD